jgi:hypothetical protein
MTILPTAYKYMEEFNGVEAAVCCFFDDLIRGDSTTFKVGYTNENAVIATAEAFGLERDTVSHIIGL